MKERFLFDRIDMAGNDLTIYETEKSAPAVFPDPTDPFQSVFDQTPVVA
jgi:hypothetical protein